MATPDSSSTAYASAADLEDRYDLRVILELASDEGAPVGAGSLDDNRRVQAALLAASGRVEAACAAGRRFDPARLALLTGASQAFLKDMVCDLAMGRLFEARPIEVGQLPVSVQKAEKLLDQIRSGHLVFGLAESIDSERLLMNTETLADVDRRRGITVIAQRLFGRRADRMWRADT